MKRFLTFFLTLCFTSVSLSAQELGSAKHIDADSVIYSTTFYFEMSQGAWIEKYEHTKANKLLEWAEANSSALIDIKGWTDKSGTKEFNAQLSLKRANAISNYLVEKGIDSSRITIEGMGIDFEADNTKARRADVVGYIHVVTKEVETPEVAEPIEPDARAAEPIEEIDTEMQVEPQSQSQPEIETPATVATEPNSSSLKTNSFKNYFTPRTNLLYWLGGMMNLGVEYKKPESNFGFLVNGGYSPFGNTNWYYNLGGWFIAPEVRYYFTSNDQWFVGAQFLAAGYNYKLSELGSQGTVIGGGVMGGYKLTLSETFDMDFTLGLGYGHLEYDTYNHDDATNTNPYVGKSIEKSSLIPIQAGVNLIWKIK